MRFRILGPLEVSDGGGWTALGPPKLRALLAILLLRGNRVVATAQLVEELWGEREPGAAANLVQQYVMRLRRALGDQGGRLLVTRWPGYQLVLADAGDLDSQRFAQLLAGGQKALGDGEVERAAGLLADALDLWHGPALMDVPPTPAVEAEAARLEEQRLVAVEVRNDAELACGRHTSLVGELRQVVREHPLRERLWGQLMLALYRSGRQAEALEAYRGLHRLLDADLGVQPGTALQELHRQILRADPVLAVRPAARVAPGRPEPVPVMPRQLPAEVAGFTGRAEELTWLRRLLTGTDAHRPVIGAIDGIGGVGKSALAIQAAQQVAERFPDGQLYVNLQGTTSGLAPLAPLQVLGRMLRALGVDPAQVPREPEEAAARFRSLTAGRRLLVLLDNALDVQQVHPLLPASPTCGVLITSRQAMTTLDGARRLHLEALPHAQALELLGRLAGRRVTAEPGAAADVVRHCARLPLAIRIAGARLAARPNWPVSELAGRLAGAAGRLDELVAGDLAVRASFDLSLDALQRSDDALEQTAAAAFGTLSLPDGPELGMPAAARLLGQPEPSARAVLERLVDAQLLESPHPGRYRFHDLLRLHARQRASAHPEPARLDALRRLTAFYTATAWHTLALLRPGDQRLAGADPRWTDVQPLVGAVAALAWLEAERANLLSAIAQAAASRDAPLAELGCQLARALFGLFVVRGYTDDGITANRTAVELARRLGGRAALAHASADLGVLLRRAGRYPEAIDCQRRSLTIFQELGDRHGQADSLNNLSNIYGRMGRYAEAIDCHQRSLTIRRRLRDRHGQAQSLSNLGVVYERMGRYAEAIDCQRRSLTIFRQLGDHQGKAVCLSNLGIAYQRIGRYRQAIDCQRRSLRIARELGDRQGQAICLNTLGNVYRRLQRHDEAINCQRRSLTFFKELGDPHGQAEALRDLGDALRAGGRHRRARVAWRAALAICEELRVPEADEVRARLAAPPAEAPDPPGPATPGSPPSP
ncbi:MAG TPA: tetratricopeptide repeat protein [Actinomycetota bacterium]|nr:tetratricopeptide repeat protein [Actinomycetota bacterium]